MTKRELLATGAELMGDFYDWCLRVHGTECDDGKITWDDLGEINGTTGNAVELRCRRRRQSRKAESGTSSPTDLTQTQKSDIRGAKAAILRSPEAAGRLVSSLPAEQKAQLAKEALADPKVRREVIEDAAVEVELVREVKAKGDRMVEASRRRFKGEAPEAANNLDALEVVNLLMKAKVNIRLATQRLNEADLDDDQRELVRSQVAPIQLGLGYIESYLNGGQSLESELAAFLAESE